MVRQRKQPKGDIKLGFESEMIDLRLDQIVPLKIILAAIQTTEK